MRKNGEIIIIEDDEDDRTILKDIFDILNYPNKVTFITDPLDAIPYLSDSSVIPFIILSDINMPKINGFELRAQILANEEISKKCVPYIFLSTSKNPENVLSAYDCHSQGYFQKQDDFSRYKILLQNIVDYWTTCLTPTNTL